MNPFTYSSLLNGTYNSIDLNLSKACCVTTLFVCNLVACRPSNVCCCCYKCGCKCFRLAMVSIQSSHISPSKCRCSLPSGNLMSCSLLTPWFCSLNYLSCGDVIYGISCLCSFGCLSCGDVIYGIIVSLFNCSYHCWHYKWFHFSSHHFLCPQIYIFLFPFHY